MIAPRTEAAPPASPITIELQAGLSAQEVDKRIARAHRAGDLAARALAFYLVDLAERGAHQELGFHSIIQYAEVRYHISPRTTRSYLLVGRALEELPAIDRALAEGRLFWTQARELVRVATPETEDAWIGAARGLSARQLAAAVSVRRKGERPGDPARRRIRNASFKVPGRLNALQWAKWNSARAKLEAELGRPVSDDEIHEHLIDLLLSTRPDGTVPGRIAVNDSHYKTLVFHDVVRARTSVETEDGRFALDPTTSQRLLRAAGRDDLAEWVDDEDENDGPEVPPEARDVETPLRLRREILARDGFRCRCCGFRKNLTVHHKKWRRFGGRTSDANLMTVCEDCHSLIHEGLLVVRGRTQGRLRFLDARGNTLRQLTSRAREAIEAMRLATVGRQDGTRVPREEDTPDGTRVPLEEDDQDGTRVPSAPGPRLDGLVGQKAVVGNLKRAVRAALERGEPAPHILLCGPPGLGKTSLARAVAGEMSARLHAIVGPLVKEPEDLLDRLALVRDGDVVFIDEIHRLPVRVAETLYGPMDAGRRFTLVGATTDEDLIPAALRGRFAVRADLEFYGITKLVEILNRQAERWGVRIDDGAAILLAGASRDTPREALTLLSAARDEAQLGDRATIDVETASAVLASLGIDDRGLCRIQRELLAALADAGGGPLSLNTLAGRVGKSSYTISTVHEPFLIRRGLIARTPRGRMLINRRR